jgi:predicted O-linked N-acetylglucosamine transferase (SPINDLY family)
LLAAWSGLLESIPRSRLLIKTNGLTHDAARERIRREICRNGIDSGRVEFREAIAEHRDHLGTYGQINIAWDAYPYCGVTTTCEALWMGVRVVTTHGDRWASRYGASLLTIAGLEPFIATSWEQYQGIATLWARSPTALGDLRAGLRDQLRRSRLLDARGFAGQVEAAYRSLWRDGRDGCRRQSG